MGDEIKRYIPMTDEEIRDHMRIAVILHIKKLPLLKGRGKANPEQRLRGMEAFADALAGTLSQSVFIRRPGWKMPVHSASNGHSEAPARKPE